LPSVSPRNKSSAVSPLDSECGAFAKTKKQTNGRQFRGDGYNEINAGLLFSCVGVGCWGLD